MKVLILNQYYPPDLANTAVLLHQLAEDLASDGFDVTVIAGRPSYDADRGDTHEPGRVRLIRVRSTGFDRAAMAGRGLNYVSYLAAATRRAWSLDRPDLVLAFTDPPFLGIGAWIAARRHRAKLVQVLYDIYPDVALVLGRMTNPVAVAAWRRLNRFTRARADRIVAIGRDMRENLIADGVPADRIELIPNWSEQNPATPDEVETTRERLGWKDRFVVLHAGNVGLGHGLGSFVDAAALAEPGGDVLFVIMGDGAARSTLERAVEDRGLANVRFIDYQPHDEAMAIIAAADCHLISLAPGLAGWIVPSKVYGIMAAGRPFIAAVESRSEIGRLAAERGCGIRVEPADPGAILRAVGEVRSADARLMGSRGRTAFDASFERGIVTARYADMLRSVLRDG
jgi:glycosyltransferase involved in cell wall biosynthesis